MKTMCKYIHIISRYTEKASVIMTEKKDVRMDALVITDNICRRSLQFVVLIGFWIRRFS